MDKKEDQKFGIAAEIKTLRYVNPGTMIIKSCPVMMGPVDKRGERRNDNSNLCLGCNGWFYPSKTNTGKCSKCQWAICSEKCENVSF